MVRMDDICFLGGTGRGPAEEPCVVRIKCGLEKGKVAGRSVLV